MICVRINLQPHSNHWVESIILLFPVISSCGATPSIDISVFPNISYATTVKLDHKNYQIWLAQIVPVLKSLKLKSFVDGSSPCPSQFLSDNAGNKTDTVNPDFEDWIQKDHLALSCIDCSLSPHVLGTIAHQYRTARETWQALEKLFASSSLKHISQLRSDLLHTTRNGRRIAEFLSVVNMLHFRFRFLFLFVCRFSYFFCLRLFLAGGQFRSNLIYDSINYHKV